MAFYGLASANLSPILFKGNRKYTGVNFIIHNDVSTSMNLYPNGSVNFTQYTGKFTGPVGAAVTLSMFNDGYFVGQLQQYLINSNIGKNDTNLPNLYAYFDTSSRYNPEAYTITNNSEQFTVNSSSSSVFMKGYADIAKFRQRWNTYINTNYGLFPTEGVTSTYFNKASILADSTQRLSGYTQSQSSEDVHGNLWSIYYTGSSLPTPYTNEITSGTPGSYAKFLRNKTRKNLPTFVITASNEQENAPENMLGIGVTTRINVNYAETVDRNAYTKPGLFGYRFVHYFDDDGQGYSSSTEGTQYYPKVSTLLAGEFNSDIRSVSGSTVTITGDVEKWFNTSPKNFPAIVERGEIPLLSVYTNNTLTGTSQFFGGSGGSTKETTNGSNVSITYAGTTVVGIASTLSFTTTKSLENFPGGPSNSYDMSGYSFMWIGYFKPRISGTWTFRTNSNEKSLIWITGDGEVDSTLTGWNYSKAKVRNTTARGPTSLVDSSSSISSFDSFTLTASKLYPIRILCGNRDYLTATSSTGNTVTWNSGSQTGSSPNNGSSFTFYFKSPTDTTTWRTDFTNFGEFYGAEDVWKLGSEFFPLPVQNVTRTIEDEIKDKKYRIISLSSYKQTLGPGDVDYDGVFFRKDGKSFDYIKLFSPSQYTGNKKYDILNSPTEITNWTFKNYYDIVQYNVSASNVINYTGTTGSGLGLIVQKYNSYYTASVNSTSRGTGYKVGDKVIVAGTTLGGTGNGGGTGNDLLLQIDQVQSSTYNISQPVSSNVFNSSTVPNWSPTQTKGTGATFSIIKNKNLTGLSYNNDGSVTLVNQGLNYVQNDRLKIYGSSIDGITGTNDLDLIVTSVDSSGRITGFSTYYKGITQQTPSGVINYTNIPVSYLPLGIVGMAYSTVSVSSVGYNTSKVSNVSYNYSTISRIGYTTSNITGIAYTSYDIASINYPNQTSATITKGNGNVSFVTITTAGAHGLVSGDYVTFDGYTGNASGFNLNTYQVDTTPTTTSFTILINITGTGYTDTTGFYINSNPNSTDLAVVTFNIIHQFKTNDQIDITNVTTSPWSSNYNARFSVNYIDDYNISLVGTSTSPYFNSNPITNEGNGTLVADAVITITPNTLFTTGIGVTVVNTSFTGLRSNFTLNAINISSGTYTLVGSKNLSYPLTSAGISANPPITPPDGFLALLNEYPKVTTSTPNTFVSGNSIYIQGASSNYPNGSYTITVIDSSNFTLNSNSLLNPATASGYTQSLTGVAVTTGTSLYPVITTQSSFPVSIGNSVVIGNTSPTSSFNGTYRVVEIINSSKFVGYNQALTIPSNYTTAVLTNGLVGLSSHVIVTTNTPHNYTVGTAVTIYGNVSGINGTSSQPWNSAWAVNRVLSSTQFTLTGTSGTSNYSNYGLGGKVADVNLGIAVTTTDPHNVGPGTTVSITGTTLSQFNATFKVNKVLNSNTFTLVTLTGIGSTSNYDNVPVSPSTVGAKYQIQSGAGSGAYLNIARQFVSNTTANYSTLSFTNPGIGYRINDILSIPGSQLGGTDASNSGITTVLNVGVNGQITQLSPIYGQADPTLDYSSPFSVDEVKAGSGSGSTWSVTRDGTGTYTVNKTTSGTNYYVNDKILIPGNQLGGNSSNDLLIRVSSVNSTDNSIVGFTFTGTSSLGDPASTVSVITLGSYISKPYNLEPEGSTLPQTHQMYELAKLSGGGLFKIDRVFIQGDPSVGISSVDKRDSFANALADFINSDG